MKKTRKIIAMLVAMVMSLSLVPQTVLGTGFDGTPEYTTELDAYFQGWERDTAIEENGSTIFTCVTDEIAHSGNHSFVLRSLDTGDKDLSLKQAVGLGEGTYTLSFWAAGTAADHDDDPYRHQQMVWLWGSTEQWAYLSNMYTGEKDGDWTYYTLDFTVPAGSTVGEVKLSTRGHGTEGLYIDDFTLVKHGTTNNLLTNGSFDFDENADYTDAYEAYFTGWGRNGGVTSNTTNVFACVTNEIAYSGNNSVVLKHTDSNQSGYMQIQQTSLCISEGTYTLSFWVAGEVNGQQVIWIKPGTTTANGDWLLINSAATGEKDGDWTKYSTTFNVASGNTVTELTIGTSGNTKGLFLDDISIVAQGDDTNLLTNGGFEEKEEVPEEPEGPTYTTELEAYFQGWERDAAIEENGSTIFTCVTDEIAHSGNHSFVLKSLDTGDKDLSLKQAVGLGEGTYTLSFWAAGTAADHDDDPYRYQQMVWLWGSTEQWAYLSNMYTGEKDGDWTKYTLDFTVPAGSTVGEVKLSTRGHGTEGLYIDDFTLVKSGTTENIIVNGGFEEKEEVPEEPEGPTYTTELDAYFRGWERDTAIEENGSTIFTCVTDEIAHSGNHSFVLKSLDTGDKDLSLKQAVGLGEGTYTLSFWAAGTAADHDDDPYRYQQMVWLWGSTEQWAYLSNMYTGEKDGDWSYYTLDFTVPAGSTVGEVKLSTRGHGTEGLYIDDFTLVKSGTTENIIVNGGFEEKESSEPEVPSEPNYTTAIESYFHGWEREYNVTENESTIFSCVMDEFAHSGSNSVILRHVDESQNEKDLLIKQTGLNLGEGTYTLSFWAAGTVADTDDDTYRYQQIVWLEGLDPSYRYVTEMTTGTTDGDWSYYTLDFTVPSGSTVSAVKLSTRGFGTEYMYIDDISLVKSGEEENLIKNGGFEERDLSVPVDVVREVILAKNRQRTDALMGAGNYSLTLVVDNSAIDTKLDVEQFVAIYDENGVLYNNVHSTAASIEKATADGAFTKIETDFDLPEGNFTVEYFVFDGRDTLNIIGSPNPHRIFK